LDLVLASHSITLLLSAEIIFILQYFPKMVNILLTVHLARRFKLVGCAKRAKKIKSWRVTPRAVPRPQTAVVYAVGFGKQQVNFRK